MRVDAGVADGSVVGVHYDPLLAKVVAHAPTRAEAARVLAAALAAARIHGIVTNRDLLVGVLRSEAFLAGETDTAFLDRHPPAELTAAGGSAGPHGHQAARGRRRPRRPGPAPRHRGRLPGRPLRLAQQPLPAPAVRPVARVPGATVSVGYRFDRTGALEALEVDGDPLAGSACGAAPRSGTWSTWRSTASAAGSRSTCSATPPGSTAPSATPSSGRVGPPGGPPVDNRTPDIRRSATGWWGARHRGSGSSGGPVG